MDNFFKFKKNRGGGVPVFRFARGLHFTCTPPWETLLMSPITLITIQLQCCVK
jgi:hypothetical protein